MKADREQLAAMAGQLRDATTELEGAAKSAPPAPEVSVSTEKVSYTLSAITKATAGLMAQVEQTASQIDSSDGSYGETDNTAAIDLHQAGSGFGQH